MLKAPGSWTRKNGIPKYIYFFNRPVNHFYGASNLGDLNMKLSLFAFAFCDSPLLHAPLQVLYGSLDLINLNVFQDCINFLNLLKLNIFGISVLSWLISLPS